MTGSQEARLEGTVRLVDGEFWYVEYTGPRRAQCAATRFALSLEEAHGMKLVDGMPITFVGQKRGDDWWAAKPQVLNTKPAPSAAALHARRH